MLGLNANTYVNTGSYVSPVWVALIFIKDLKVPLDFDKHESSMRGTGGIKTNEATLLDIPISGSALYIPGNAQFANFMVRHAGRIQAEYAFADQAIVTSGCRYVRATCGSFKFDESQNLAENVMADFELGPSAFNADGTLAVAATLNVT